MYSRRAVVLIVAFIATNFMLGIFKPIIGIGAYSIGLGTLVIVFVIMTWREGVRQIPEGMGASDEKTISLRVDYEKVGAIVVRAIEGCGWQLTETRSDQEYFKGKIGRTIHTLHGQMFTIDVTKVDEYSSTLHVSCEASHQLLDYGQNNAMIDKFTAELEKSLHSV